MARKAKILFTALDYFGRPWDVRNARDTPHGWPILFGWPADELRGQHGCGGPQAILTPQVAEYLKQIPLKEADLPIARAAIRRLCVLLGLCQETKSEKKRKRSGHAYLVGRLPPRYADLSGQAFGKWTVTAFDHVNDRGVAKWRCVCKCGTEGVVAAGSLLQGTSTQCMKCRNAAARQARVKKLGR